MDLFFQDPWWLILIKVVALFVILLVWTIFNVWYERRLVGKMQHRLGPIMNGPFGLGQALADGAKLLAKEDFRPKNADKWVFNLAPILTGVAAFTCWTVIPFGGEVEMFGVTTRLQLTDTPVAAFFIMAVASIGIYGIVLAGWAGNSTYSFLGSIRSTAQMISYEISMVGETNRAPFDLPECESELVSGYLTEYSGFRYAMFFLAEYINMATVSAVCTTLFLGGYLAPWPLNLIPFMNNAWLGPIWFVLKVQLLFSVFVWLRGTLPRLRYDQFMDLGWKVLIEVSLIWIVMIAIFPQYSLALAVLLTAGCYLVFGEKSKAIDEPEIPAPDPDRVFDPFAGGYPVPPMPGQALPELVGVVAGAKEDDPTPAVEAEGKDA